MGFVINHAPASIAMSLAQQAGQGDRVMREAQLRAQQQQQQIALADQAQRARAFEISSALDTRRLDVEDRRYQSTAADRERQYRDAMKQQQLDNAFSASKFEYDKTKDAATHDLNEREHKDRTRLREEYQRETNRKNTENLALGWDKSAQGWDRSNRGWAGHDLNQQKVNLGEHWMGVKSGQKDRALDQADTRNSIYAGSVAGQQASAEQSRLIRQNNSLAARQKNLATGYGGTVPPENRAQFDSITRIMAENDELMDGLTQQPYQPQPGNGPAGGSMAPPAPMAPPQQDVGPLRDNAVVNPAAEVPYKRGEIYIIPDTGRKASVSGNVYYDRMNPADYNDGDLMLSESGEWFIWDAARAIPSPLR